MATRILAGRYEILERIGDGGMAVVFKARCRLLNRFVAIKILKPEYINDAKFIDSFRRESQAAASLSHPNIVNVYDVGKEGNIYYIVMELLEGDTLSDVIKREAPMDPKRVVTITKQIASALSHAHKNNIIHRDVKPHNILMAPDGTAKITDFGIAKAVNSGTIVNNTNTVMGSVHYLSPEQARGGYIDEKSDIYSLGIVMYEMLTGKVPFDGENAVAVAMMHMNNDVPAPSLEVSSIPPSLDAIVVRATNKYQSNRYKSAQDMYNALVTAGFEISSGRTAARAIGMNQPASTGTKDLGYTASQAKEIDIQQAEEYYEEPQFSASDQNTAVSDRNNIHFTRNGRGGALKEEVSSEEASRKKKKNGKNKKNNGKKAKTSNKVKVLAIVLALVCAVPASLGILSMMSGGGDEVKVPTLTGMTVEQAIEALSDENLDYKLGEEIYSDMYEVGQVAAQKPDPNEEVKEGYKVTLNISKGKEGSADVRVPVDVPNLVGKSEADAVSIIKSYGFTEGEHSYIESELPKGTVISQTPDALTEGHQGDAITLVVSKGKAEETTLMPQLIGKNIDEAKALLETSGILITSIATGYSNEYEENIVMEQEYPEGSTLVKGTSIVIKVSLGPEKPVAKDVPFTVSYADAANEAFYLTVTVTDDNGLRVVVDSEQRLKSNGSETITLTGTGKGSVRVIFDETLISENYVDFETGTVD